MSTQSMPGWRDDINRVGRQFTAWRRSRRTGARIPEALWRAAVSVAQRHGVSKTALGLGLDYYSLKNRLEAHPGKRAVREGAEARFVELPLRTLPGGPACVIDVEDGRGVRLHLELQGLGAQELTGVLHSVWTQPG